MNDPTPGDALYGSTASALAPLIFRLYQAPPLRRLMCSLAIRTERGRFRSRTIRRIIRHYHGVDVGAYSYGGGFTHSHWMPPGVSIGRYVSIAPGVRVFLRNHPLDSLSTHPFFFNTSLGVAPIGVGDGEEGSLRIEHDAWVGANAIVTAGCSRVGIGAVVGAGSIVTKDVPDFAIVAGNPAKILRFRFDPEAQRMILKSRWWEQSIDELQRFRDAMSEPITQDLRSNRLIVSLLKERWPDETTKGASTTSSTTGESASYS